MFDWVVFDWSWVNWAIVALAGFLGGVLNAVAGGGSFITLPALVFVGVPPIAANTTGTAALLPGYIASAWRFRRDIEYPAGLSLKTISMVALLGGGIGAALLLLTSSHVFSVLIPWLILISTIAFIVGPLFLRKRKPSKRSVDNNIASSAQWVNLAVLLIVCTYGGYFNGGLGIILLAAFGLMGQNSLHGMNGLKSIVSALLTVIAVCVYAIGDTLEFHYLLVLSVASVLGGYFGAALTYRLTSLQIRSIIILVGLFMSAVFFHRAYF